jgi:hypothetical protein
MGTTTLVIPNETLAAVGLTHRKTLVQVRHNQYPLAGMIMRKKKTAVGDILIMPFDTARHSFPTKLDTGFETYQRIGQTIITPGYSQPQFLCQPVLISSIDRAKNSGATHLLDLAKSRITNVELDLSKQITQVLFQGPAASLGTYNGHPDWSGWNTLNGIDGSLGLLEATTTGTNTFNNLSKGSFPPATHPLFHNLWSDLAGAAGTNVLNSMYQMGIDAEIRYGAGALTSGRFEWYLSRLLAGFVKRALRPFERYNGDGSMDDGKRVFDTYQGVPVIPTVELALSGATTTATQRMSGVLIDWENVEPQFYSGWQMNNTSWVDISGMTPGSQVSLFMIGGNFVFGPAGSFGLLTNGEVF